MNENHPAPENPNGPQTSFAAETAKSSAPPTAEAPVNLRTVPLDFRQKLRFIAGYLLGTLLVMLGLVLGLAQASERHHDSQFAAAASAGLLWLGTFVLWSARARHLGGARSFLGAATAIAGLEFLLVGMWDALQAGRLEGAGILAGLFLLFIGGSLFFLGHKVHQERWKVLLLRARSATDRKIRLELELARIKKQDHYGAETHCWLAIPCLLFGLGLVAVAVHGGWHWALPAAGGLAMGIVCLRWYFRPHRGGLATIAGGCMLFFGLLVFAVAWEDLAVQQASHTLMTIALAALGMTVGGCFLLWAGHRLHLRRTRYLNEKLLPALKAIETGAAPAVGESSGEKPAAGDAAARSGAGCGLYRALFYWFSIGLLLGGLVLAWGILRAGNGQPLLVSWPLVMLGTGALLAWWAVNGWAGNGISLAGLLLAALALALIGTGIETYLQLSQADGGFLVLMGLLGLAGLVGGLLLVAAGHDLAAPLAEPVPGEAQPVPWRQRWRPFGKRLALAAAALALFYLIEHAHGWLSWRSLKKELTVAGERLDWKDFIPAPVPDDQNFAAAPVFRQWPLMRTGSVAQAQPPLELLPYPPFRPGSPVTIATMKEAAKQSSHKVDLRLLKAPAAFDERQEAIAINDVSLFSALAMLFKLGEMKWMADDTNALEQARVNASFSNVSPRMVALHLVETQKLVVLKIPGDEAIHISTQDAVFNVNDVLAWYQPYATNLAALYAAAGRPQARLNADFSSYNWRLIPEYVRFRTVAQILATHANACLLAGQPETALLDLQVIEKEALALSSHPSMIGAMVSVAFHGLAASVIEEGMAEGAWREPQLVALQKSLGQYDLPVTARFGIEVERARICTAIQRASRKKLGDLLVEEMLAPETWGRRVGLGPRLLARFQDIAMQVVPRGWFYQNQCTIARYYHQQLVTSGLGTGSGAVNLPPGTSDFAMSGWSYLCPYRFLAPEFCYDYGRAGQTAKRNQAILDMARAACALERHRLARAEYPVALSDLVPQFLDKVPADVMDRQPLRYRRAPNGKYLLYSVGNNIADDGGASGKHYRDPESKDWVWQGVPK